ncbi:MAG: CAP domain-containing protein [Planctomycetota bacterium]|jgi:uncharacterized protein YkwD
MISMLGICATVLLAVDAAEQQQLDDVELIAIERNIITFTNAERTRRGLHELEVNTDLVNSARKHCSWMTRNRTLRHAPQTVAENIAVGQKDSKSVVRTWMNSSGHRANILNRSYRKIGAAAYRTPSGRIYWCQQFRR